MAPADTRAQLDSFAGISPPDDAFDPDTGEVRNPELERAARAAAAQGRAALRAYVRSLSVSEREPLREWVGTTEHPGALLQLAQRVDAAAADAATEPPAGIPSTAAPGTAPVDAAAAPAGEPRSPLPDPAWQSDFAALAPLASDLADEEVSWRPYVEGLQYLISKASKADLEAVELSKNVYLKRLRAERPDLHQTVTRALGARAKELAGGAA